MQWWQYALIGFGIWFLIGGIGLLITIKFGTHHVD